MDTTLLQGYIAICGVTKLEHNGRIFDESVFKMKWVRQSDGCWDLILYIKYITPMENKWIIDRYLESHIPEKEYFKKKLSGELRGA